MRGNKLPKITWRWLRANDSQVEIGDLYKKDYSKLDSFGQISHSLEDEFEKLDYGVSKDLVELNKEFLNWENNINLAKGEEYRDEKEVILDASDDFISDSHNIHLAEGSKAYLLLDYKSEGDLEVFRNSLIRIKAEKNSRLDLVVIQRLDKKASSFLSIAAQVEELAQVNIIQVELGGAKTYFNYKANLLEENSKTDVKTAYYVDEDRQLDIAYVVNHWGKRTFSDILVNGALKDTSKKRFTGTIDFKTGSAESEGSEEEFVTLIDEEVKSIAIPLLLASEHDISGNHAASAGRVDEKMLNYIMSRGFSEKEAKSIVVEAKMAPTLDLIPNEEIRDQLKEFIHEGIVE